MTAIDHPDHYQYPSGVECVDISRHLPHALASALEYVWRWRHKGGVEDLRKARWWLNDWIDHPVGFQPRGWQELDIDDLRRDPDYPILYAIAKGYAARAIVHIDETIAEMVDDA